MARPYWWLRLDYALAGSPSAAALKRELREGAPMHCEPKVAEVEVTRGRSLLAPGLEWPFAAPMSWDDVRALQRMNMTIGSHSITHPNLAQVDDETLEGEMIHSRERIERETSDECRHFCYPYGAHSEKVCDAARRAGYRSAVTTMSPGWNEPGTDPFRLRRFALPGKAYKLGRILSV
jgi:peptidoglycan/xylan/chitin deacetylase (PgdA/CDA1 family)